MAEAPVTAFMAPMDRWGRPVEPNPFVTCGHHQQALERHLARARAIGGRWLPMLGVLLLATVLAAWRYALQGAGVGIMAVGLYLVAFPYATPETVRMLGFQRSIQVVQAIAWLLVVAGVILLGAGGRR